MVTRLPKDFAALNSVTYSWERFLNVLILLIFLARNRSDKRIPQECPRSMIGIYIFLLSARAHDVQGFDQDFEHPGDRAFQSQPAFGINGAKRDQNMENTGCALIVDRDLVGILDSYCQKRILP